MRGSIRDDASRPRFWPAQRARRSRRGSTCPRRPSKSITAAAGAVTVAAVYYPQGYYGGGYGYNPGAALFGGVASGLLGAGLAASSGYYGYGPYYGGGWGSGWGW